MKTLSLTPCAPCKQLRLGVNSAKNTKPPVKLGISKHCLIFFRSTLAWIVLRQGFVVKKRYQSNDRDYIASHFCNWRSIFVKSQSVNLDSVFFEATNKCLLLYSGVSNIVNAQGGYVGRKKEQTGLELFLTESKRTVSKIGYLSV